MVMMRAGIKPSLRAVSLSTEKQRGWEEEFPAGARGRVTWTLHRSVTSPGPARRCRAPALPSIGSRAAAPAAGVVGARERMGKETTGLPDLLVFPGVWYTVATHRAAAERLCTEGFS